MSNQNQEDEMSMEELARQMAAKSGLTQKDAEAALMAILHTMEEATERNDPVELVGFGTWEVRQRAARKGLNPRTKEPLDILAARVPPFKAGKALKDIASGKQNGGSSSG